MFEKPSPTNIKDVSPSIFSLLFFFSGISGLIYQIVWMRMLIRVFGISLYAISTTVAVFMGGLAIGSWIAGVYFRNVKSSLRLYSFIEAMIGLTAIAASIGMKYLPFLYSLVGSGWYGSNSTGSFLALLAIRFIFAALILLVPTILMGATLPALGQYIAYHHRSPGQNLASLYGMNTLGAVVGVLMTGFFTLAVVGESGSIALGVSINLIIFLVSFTLSKNEYENVNASSVSLASDESNDRFFYWIACATGFCAISLEVLWSRLLIFLVGSSVYAFSIVLSVFLLGVATGSLVSRKFVDHLKNPAQLFGVIQILISVSALMSLYVFWKLGIYNSEPYFLYSPLRNAGSLFQFLGFSALILFVATFLMGFSFPILGKAIINSRATFATSVGNLYAWNTMGGVFGSLMSGYLLVPFMGTQSAICLISFLGLIIGAAVYIRHSKPGRNKWFIMSGVTFIFLIVVPSKTVIVLDVLQRRLERHFHNFQILFHREEAAGILTGVEIPQGKILLINGIITSGNGIPGHVMSHLPLLMHPNPKSAAVVCFGVGNTFRAAVDHIGHVDAVELMPGVVKSFGDFYQESEKYLSAPGVNVFLEDGRQHLLMTKHQYDVIIVDASPPLFSAGTVNLYSKEFLDICRHRLSSDGIMCLWVPTPCFEQDYWQIAKSFSLVYPHLLTWSKEGMAGVLLMGSSSDLKQSFSAVASRIKVRELGESRSWLTSDFINDANVYFNEDIRKTASAYPPVTDDHPLTEFPLGSFFRGRKYWISNDFLSGGKSLRN